MGGNELFITLPYTEFQPTHPVWGETNYTDTSRHGVTISIHPSRVGWDTLSLSVDMERKRFQSTHPVWDGTRIPHLQSLAKYDFNPPIPCGMGLVKRHNLGGVHQFQSTHPVWDGTHFSLSRMF